jgi:hypothetical protein
MIKPISLLFIKYFGPKLTFEIKNPENLNK